MVDEREGEGKAARMEIKREGGAKEEQKKRGNKEREKRGGREGGEES